MALAVRTALGDVVSLVDNDDVPAALLEVLSVLETLLQRVDRDDRALDVVKRIVVGRDGARIVDLETALRDFVVLAEVALDVARIIDHLDRVRDHLLHALDSAFIALDTRHPLGSEFRTSVAATLRCLEERLLHDTEAILVIAQPDGAPAETRAELKQIWKLLCLNQFHDILTGTSIPVVFDDARRDFRDIMHRASQLRDAALGTLFEGGEACALFNPAPVPFAGPALVSGGTGDQTIDPTGRLARLVDKLTARDVLRSGQDGNQLWVFEDRPIGWDAWDIDVFHEDRSERIGPADSIELIETGPMRGDQDPLALPRQPPRAGHPLVTRQIVDQPGPGCRSGAARVHRCDLLENDSEPVDLDDNECALDVAPFEIVTLR